jgi:hypothetical protein
MLFIVRKVGIEVLGNKRQDDSDFNKTEKVVIDNIEIKKKSYKYDCELI